MAKPADRAVRPELLRGELLQLIPVTTPNYDGIVAKVDEMVAWCTKVEGQLAERKLIDRAKGILMRRTGADEQTVFDIIRRSSQNRSKPMGFIAAEIIRSEEARPR